MKLLKRLPRGTAQYFLLVGLLISVTACGGGGDPLSFDLCGNGMLDSGEQCDDGPGIAHSNDNDGCLSTCQLASCGDGFIQEGVEACDGNNLGRCGAGTCQCSDLGLSNGTLKCSAACGFDVSTCGAPLPPTTTPTATPTATPSPTALAGQCGNNVIEADETCDDGNLDNNDECPSDCRVHACLPTTTRIAATVVANVPEGASPRSMTVLLNYPDGVVDLPNSQERARLRSKGGVSLTLEVDYQHALRVRLNRNQGIVSGDIYSADFDACAGSAAPQVSDFSCQVLACDNVAGCLCSVEMP